jgi:hypothetical protein
VEATHDKRVKDHVHTVPTSFISAIFFDGAFGCGDGSKFGGYVFVLLYFIQLFLIGIVTA